MAWVLRKSLRRVLPKNCKALLRRVRDTFTRRTVITIRNQATTIPQGRALLAYVQEPFHLYPEDPANVQFSNVGIARSLALMLNARGYIVDVVQWSDRRFTPKQSYDIFIGHGGLNFERISLALAPQTPKIYFATGLYWQEHNQREEARFQWLVQRRGVHLPFDRLITQSEEGALQAADGVLCLGNHRAADSYRKFPPVIAINNGVYHDARYSDANKDFERGRTKFLFFSSIGNVHKGLDLLLEAFTQVSDAHLYVCQEIASEFAETYREELFHRENIHVVGRIPLRSPLFYELMERCNFVIHLSCSEGQPGSVLDAMHQGLIPVLTRENNISMEDFGVMVEDCSPNAIARLVRELMQRAPEWCREMSQRTRQVTLTAYSETAFRHNAEQALQSLTAQIIAGRKQEGQA